MQMSDKGFGTTNGNFKFLVRLRFAHVGLPRYPGPIQCLTKSWSTKLPLVMHVHYVSGSQAILTVNNSSRCGDRVNQTEVQPSSYQACYRDTV